MEKKTIIEGNIRTFEQLFFNATVRTPGVLKSFNEEVLNILNVGPGYKHIRSSKELDLPEYDADKDNMPYKDNTIHSIHAYHFLEHLKDPVKFLLDAQRVLMEGGVVNIGVPYYKSNCAFQDLDHKKFFTEDTWKTLFSNNYYNKNKIEWKFQINFNIIAGINERNLMLLTQLEKTK